MLGIKPRNLIALLLVLPVILATTVSGVNAQDSVRITISPTSFDFGLNPGAIETNVIKVTNPSQSDLELEVDVENIIGADELGKIQLSEEETEFSLSSWVTFTPERFRLKAGENRTVSYTIRVPANAEPGGHYGSILVGTIAAEGTATGSQTVQRLGSLLLVRVAGQANEKAVTANFSPKTFVGEWEEIKSSDNTTTFYIPRQEMLDEEKASTYFNNGPIAFDLRIKNNGNVHIRPSGFVTIYNIFGKKVAELAIEPKNVFPGVERQLTVLWPQKKHWGIYYKVQLVAVYGQSNQPLTSTTAFWAFPMIPAIVIGALLVFIIVARKRLVKVIRVLIKG
ncbi:MAG: DUF916 domain-containing protein [Patescibacteria group bacterium]